MEYDSDGYTVWSDWSYCDVECKQSRQRFCDATTCAVWGSVQKETRDCLEECDIGNFVVLFTVLHKKHILFS